jgi:hypothetical protein
MRCLVVLLIAFLSVVPAAQSPGGPEWLGEWRLSLEKSIYNPGPPPYRRGRMEVTFIGDQVRFAYDLVLPRGGVQRMEWTGRFDGNDYMVQGIDDYITYAYTPVDARTFSVVTKLDQRAVAVSTVTMSEDGTTLTSVTGGTNARGEEIVNTTVYEKVR